MVLPHTGEKRKKPQTFPHLRLSKWVYASFRRKVHQFVHSADSSRYSLASIQHSLVRSSSRLTVRSQSIDSKQRDVWSRQTNNFLYDFICLLQIAPCNVNDWNGRSCLLGIAIKCLYFYSLPALKIMLSAEQEHEKCEVKNKGEYPYHLLPIWYHLSYGFGSWIQTDCLV